MELKDISDSFEVDIETGKRKYFIKMLWKTWGYIIVMYSPIYQKGHIDRIDEIQDIAYYMA